MTTQLTTTIFWPARAATLTSSLMTTSHATTTAQGSSLCGKAKNPRRTKNQRNMNNSKQPPSTTRQYQRLRQTTKKQTCNNRSLVAVSRWPQPTKGSHPTQVTKRRTHAQIEWPDTSLTNWNQNPRVMLGFQPLVPTRRFFKDQQRPITQLSAPEVLLPQIRKCWVLPVAIGWLGLTDWQAVSLSPDRKWHQRVVVPGSRERNASRGLDNSWVTWWRCHFQRRHQRRSGMTTNLRSCSWELGSLAPLLSTRSPSGLYQKRFAPPTLVSKRSCVPVSPSRPVCFQHCRVLGNMCVAHLVVCVVIYIYHDHPLRLPWLSIATATATTNHIIP